MNGLRLVPCPPELPRADDPVAALPPGVRAGATWPQPETLGGLGAHPDSRLIVLDDEAVGGCGLVGAPVGDRQEIGYDVVPAFRRRGVGTAAIALLVEELTTAEACAYTLEGNEPSWRLLERLGFGQTESDRAGHRLYVRAVRPDGGSGSPG